MTSALALGQWEPMGSATRALHAYNGTCPFGHFQDDLSRWYDNFVADKRSGKVDLNASFRSYLTAACDRIPKGGET